MRQNVSKVGVSGEIEYVFQLNAKIELHNRNVNPTLSHQTGILIVDGIIISVMMLMINVIQLVVVILISASQKMIHVPLQVYIERLSVLILEA